MRYCLKTILVCIHIYTKLNCGNCLLGTFWAGIYSPGRSYLKKKKKKTKLIPQRKCRHPWKSICRMDAWDNDMMPAWGRAAGRRDEGGREQGLDVVRQRDVQ